MTTKKIKRRRKRRIREIRKMMMHLVMTKLIPTKLKKPKRTSKLQRKMIFKGNWMKILKM